MMMVAGLAAIASTAGVLAGLAYRRTLSAQERFGAIGVGVVIAASALALLLALGVDRSWTALVWAILSAALVVLVVVDVRHRWLPREVSYPATALSAAVMIVDAVANGRFDAFVEAVIGAAAATSLFVVIYLVSRGGLGDGDVRMAPLLGLHLGWVDIGLVPLGLLLGFFLGALVGAGAIVFGRATRSTTMPFGPFLALGTLVAVGIGEPGAHLFWPV